MFITFNANLLKLAWILLGKLLQIAFKKTFLDQSNDVIGYVTRYCQYILKDKHIKDVCDASVAKLSEK